LFAGRQLGDGRQRAQEPRLVLGRGSTLNGAQELDDAEGQTEGGLELGLEPSEGVDVQRLLRQGRAELHATTRVVARESQAAAHEADGADRVPRPRDVEHRCDVADPVSDAGDREGERSVEGELGRRHLSRAELVLEAIDGDPVQRSRLVAGLDVEEGQPPTAWRLALGSCEGERHLRAHRGGEPLRSVEAVGAAEAAEGGIGVGTRDRLAQAHIRATGALRHPLARRPGP
jgi:hypothetical protein